MEATNRPVNKFALNFCHLLDDRNITREKIAEELGVEPRTVYYWIGNQRHPNYDCLIKISRLLSVSIDDLLIWGGRFLFEQSVHCALIFLNVIWLRKDQHIHALEQVWSKTQLPPFLNYRSWFAEAHDNSLEVWAAT